MSSSAQGYHKQPQVPETDEFREQMCGYMYAVSIPAPKYSIITWLNSFSERALATRV